MAHGQWNQDLLLNDAVSFNRLIVIIYPTTDFLFSRRAVIGISISVYVLGFVIAWFADLYLSCCKFYLYYRSYSYAFLDTDYNVANIFVDTPINLITSSIAIINYIIVSLYARN